MDSESRLDGAWQAFTTGENDVSMNLLQILLTDLTARAEVAGVLSSEIWTNDIDDYLGALTSIGTITRQAGNFVLSHEIGQRICAVADRWFMSNRHAMWYYANSTNEIAIICGCKYFSTKELEYLVTLLSKLSSMREQDGESANEAVHNQLRFVESRINSVKSFVIDPEVLIMDSRVIGLQTFKSKDSDSDDLKISSAWPAPDLDGFTAPNTFDEGVEALKRDLRMSETLIDESQEMAQNGELTDALERSGAALTTAEATAASFRGAYGAHLTLAKAIQQRARVLEELGLVVESLRERSLAEGVLQDAIVAFPRNPELLFTLSWIQSQLGAAKIRLNQSTQEAVAHYVSGIESLNHARSDESYQPVVIELLAIYEYFLMKALSRHRQHRQVYAHANVVFELLQEIRKNDPDNGFPFEMVGRIAFLTPGVKGKLLKRMWFNALK